MKRNIVSSLGKSKVNIEANKKNRKQKVVLRSLPDFSKFTNKQRIGQKIKKSARQSVT